MQKKYQRAFIALSNAASLARQFVCSELASLDLPADVVDNVELIVSELVTNAANAWGVLEIPEGITNEHLVTITLVVTDDKLKVLVHDCAPGAPEKRSIDESKEGGRGLTIVEALAQKGGVEPHSMGKTVWVEMPSRL